MSARDPRPIDDSKVFIGLSNPKSPSNVGSVMRAAGNFRVNSVFYSGERYSRAMQSNSKIAKLGRRVGQEVPLCGVDTLLDAVEDDVQIVCVEFAENAIPLTEYQHPDKAFYIFGPEDGTLSQELIDKADAVLYIPTVGCMNLAATVNVLLYDRLLKSDHHFDGNALIRKSRDTNNNIKVKNNPLK